MLEGGRLGSLSVGCVGENLDIMTARGRVRSLYMCGETNT